MLGCPDQWVELVRWLWSYGNARAIALEAMAARRGASHPPIAEETLLTCICTQPERIARTLPSPSPLVAQSLVARTGLLLPLVLILQATFYVVRA